MYYSMLAWLLIFLESDCFIHVHYHHHYSCQNHISIVLHSCDSHPTSIPVLPILNRGTVVFHWKMKSNRITNVFKTLKWHHLLLRIKGKSWTWSSKIHLLWFTPLPSNLQQHLPYSLMKHQACSYLRAFGLTFCSV